MRIIHRIAADPEREVVVALREFGIQIDPNLPVTIVFVDHNDPRWPNISKVVVRYRIPNLLITEFDQAELGVAQHLALLGSWHYGYPMPDDDFGYLNLTYDLSEYCSTCGAGARQVNPFRMRKEPVWGRRSVLQLNWVFDEFFVRPETYREIFEPLGIACLPVLKYKSDTRLETVVQLCITDYVDLDMADRSFEVCKICKRIKYPSANAGFYPKPLTNLARPIFRSNQQFGSGLLCYNRIMISNRLYQDMNKSAIKGIEFGACTD